MATASAPAGTVAVFSGSATDVALAASEYTRMLNLGCGNDINIAHVGVHSWHDTLSKGVSVAGNSIGVLATVLEVDKSRKRQRQQYLR